MVIPPERVSESVPVAESADEDLRLVAAQVAHEMREALRRHGWALTAVRPELPVGGAPYVRFSQPLHKDVARRIIAGLQRLRLEEPAP
ncbi:hypothetical protein [Streptomyces sp. 8N706]|uniref:hypothetical protein n=1 Tax=Streptomyces sp. 8N706 TaxID=3457416 RepID=UPI003FD018C4